MRDPAWTDRVLWSGRAISSFVNYGRHEILSSDHRPVSALMKVKVKSVLREEEQMVMRDVVRQLDMKENNRIPHCALSSQCVEFEEVRINHSLKQSVTLTNESSHTVRNIAPNHELERALNHFR